MEALCQWSEGAAGSVSVRSSAVVVVAAEAKPLAEGAAVFICGWKAVGLDEVSVVSEVVVVSVVVSVCAMY